MEILPCPCCGFTPQVVKVRRMFYLLGVRGCSFCRYVLGTSAENRDYILKDGKWKDTEKGTTSIPDSFEKYGECPSEHQGKSRESDKILELLRDGASNLEVIDAVPSAMKFIDKIGAVKKVPSVLLRPNSGGQGIKALASAVSVRLFTSWPQFHQTGDGLF